jgi:VWFA-related protein
VRPSALTGAIAFVAVATSYVVSGVGRTAQPPDRQPSQPTFRTEANYVRVDVYPTRDGAPIADLRQEEFEVLEGGVVQKIEQFEHVVIRTAGPQELRIEPNTVAESRSMAESSRARLFVLFLDTYHVDVGGSHNIRKPLVDALDRAIGPDDLVGVMTPEMSAAYIAFARKTTTIDGFLTRYWHWGERDRALPPDPDDEQYGFCYPNVSQNDKCSDQNGIAAEMIDRRHEKRALDALQDLVRYLRGLREERKAILAITDGWLLYRPNQTLMRPLRCHGVPDQPGIGVDPRSGKLTAKDRPDAVAPEGKCGIDRIHLAQIDDEQQFRQLLDEANAANASFYPVDPRGLAVFDTPLMRMDVPGAPPPVVPLAVDRAMLSGRLNSLRTLAEATDGLAIVNSNDLAGGLKRVVADLSSYYLLGYYSSGKLDGKFHSITVRVKRPGVQVRARRGYLAATPGAMTAAAASAAAAAAPARIDAERAAVTAVIGPLAGYARELPLRVQAATGWKPGDPPVAAVWVVGELSGAPEFGDVSKGGAVASVELAPPDGATLASGRATMAVGARTFRVTLVPTQPLAPGEYLVRVAARGTDATIPSRDTVHVAISPAPLASGAIWNRRGTTTGNRDLPTADLRFRRSEQVRVEIPTPSAEGGAARLLDRTGRPLAIPVVAAVRSDGDGSRWLTAQVALAPLAPGDYVIELSEGNNRMLAAFRIVP